MLGAMFYDIGSMSDAIFHLEQVSKQCLMTQDLIVLWIDESGLRATRNRDPPL